MSENKDWLIICGPIFRDRMTYHIVKGPVSTGVLKQRVESLVSSELSKRQFRHFDSPLDDAPMSPATIASYLKISSAFSSVFRVVMVGPETWMKTVDQTIFQEGFIDAG